ncbi:MAG: DUF1028 domain-containing protein [Thermoplasmata archaeon]|nr:DUF1028 domain-containing protein [Thermoplasmata archaeon]
MTFSIVAIDPETGEAGFAIASCCWDAGQVCMAKPTGAIASQANGNVQFLSIFFEKLDEGLSLEQIMEHLRTIDPDIQTRQIGMVSPGKTFAFTGEKCSFWNGHRTGKNYSCQGNILVGPQVIEAMARTFESAEGQLFERLYAAMKAADAAGGDSRGRQSARLMVAGKGAGAIDITIEDSENPVAEMGRILDVRRNLVQIFGYLGEFSKAEDADKLAILEKYRDFLDDKREPRYLDWWETLADSYYKIGEREKAIEIYRIYLAINPGMARIFRENAKAGNFPKDVARALDIKFNHSNNRD